MNKLQTEQSKLGREINYLCAECEILQCENTSLRRTISQLEERLDRHENYSRQNNLLFHGIPKKQNESCIDCEQGVRDILRRVLGPEKSVPVDRAYRTGTAVVAWFASLKDRDLVLSNVKRLRGTGYSVREDVSPTVRLRQKGLLPLYRDLRMDKKRANIYHDKLVTNEGVFTYDLNTKSVVKVDDSWGRCRLPAESMTRSQGPDSMVSSSDTLFMCSELDCVCTITTEQRSQKSSLLVESGIGSPSDGSATSTVDADEGVARATSPLSIPDTMDIFDEMSCDSGISTLTTSATAPSTIWEITHALLKPGQGCTHTEENDIKKPGPASLPCNVVPSDPSNPATTTVVDNPWNVTMSHHIEAKHIDDGKFRRESVKHEGIIFNNTSFTLGGETSVQENGDNHEERSILASQHGLGVGWFSYIQGDSRLVKGVHDHLDPELHRHSTRGGERSDSNDRFAERPGAEHACFHNSETETATLGGCNKPSHPDNSRDVKEQLESLVSINVPDNIRGGGESDTSAEESIHGEEIVCDSPDAERVTDISGAEHVCHSPRCETDSDTAPEDTRSPFGRRHSDSPQVSLACNRPRTIPTVSVDSGGSFVAKTLRLPTLASTKDAEKDVGWHRSGGKWQYTHKRAMGDVRQHPANKGALKPDLECVVPPSPTSPVVVNGNGPFSTITTTNGDGEREVGVQEQDRISLKLTEMKDSILHPIKEDLSEWITRIIGVSITPDNFMEVLDSGVALCTISKLIEKHAKDYEKQGKLNEPLPQFKLRCNSKAKSGTWFSRDNMTNFLGWCRAYGMTDETMFDSEDLVSHKQEKPIVNCVLELARIGWKYGIEPPNLIRMEREIENEAEEFEPPPYIPPPPPPPPKPKPVEPPVEIKKPEKIELHKEVKRLANKCKCQEYVNRISEGVYDVFGKRVFIRLLHGTHLMVRVGGGWDTFENYLTHHDPIQVYEFRRPASSERLKTNFDGYLVIRSKYKS